MRSTKQYDAPHYRPGSWRRLGLGVLGFAAVLFFFTRGVTPPGVFGDVVRHNRAEAIDATPYFYSEVENIVELQAGLDKWWSSRDSAECIPPVTQDSIVTSPTD